MKILAVSLIIGFIVGFLAQRSRMCFVGGWRDFFLVRDTYLLKGFVSFFVTATLCFFVFYTAGQFVRNYPWFSRSVNSDAGILEVLWSHESYTEYRSLSYCDLANYPLLSEIKPARPAVFVLGLYIPLESLLYLASAFAIGFFSVLANGCPLRQHVLAASGDLNAWLYMTAFYGGILLYDRYLSILFARLIN